MTRRFAALLCSVFLVLCSAAPLAAAASGDRRIREQKQAEIRAGLMETDAEFAASETAFEAAREKFLTLFSGRSRQWADSCIKSQTPEYSGAPGYLSGEQSKRHREDFFRRQAETTRYMALLTETPCTSPDFALLLRPVLLHAGRHSAGEDSIGKTLAAYDARRPGPAGAPEGYESRRVNGRHWGLIRFDGQKMRGSDGADVNLAFVLRAAGGTFTLHPVIAPSTESYYPGESLPLRPAGGSYSKGPAKERITDCEMGNKLTVTNEEGPFAFRVDAEQLFDGGNLSFACQPKCTGFAYAWSEKSQTYLRGPGECRDDDGWRATFPFNGDILVPVAAFAETLRLRSPALRTNDEAVDAAWNAFLPLFDEKTRAWLKTEYDAWRYDRQEALYRFVGKDVEFAAAAVAGDRPVLDFMRRARELAARPDARLLVLLDALHERMASPPSSGRGGHRDERENGGPHYRSRLLDGREQPLLSARFSRQIRLLQPPAKPAGTGRVDGSAAYAATGLEGGPRIAFTYETPRNASYRAGREKLPDIVNSFRMIAGGDGAFWGLAEIQKAPRGKGDHGDKREAATRITRIHDGTIAFVTPALPEEAAFFKNPKLSPDNTVIWQYPQTDRRYYYGECDMAPALAVDADTAPFAVTAVDRQIFGRAGEDRAWRCTPECRIPFAWNGSAYAPQPPDCLPEGQWGVKEPDLKTNP